MTNDEWYERKVEECARKQEELLATLLSAYTWLVHLAEALDIDPDMTKLAINKKSTVPGTPTVEMFHISLRDSLAIYEDLLVKAGYKEGRIEPELILKGRDRAKADMLWRDPDARKRFEEQTGILGPTSDIYEREFRMWAVRQPDPRVGPLPGFTGELNPYNDKARPPITPLAREVKMTNPATGLDECD